MSCCSCCCSSGSSNSTRPLLSQRSSPTWNSGRGSPTRCRKWWRGSPPSTSTWFTVSTPCCARSSCGVWKRSEHCRASPGGCLLQGFCHSYSVHQSRPNGFIHITPIKNPLLNFVAFPAFDVSTCHHIPSVFSLKLNDLALVNAQWKVGPFEIAVFQCIFHFTKLPNFWLHPVKSSQ